ncbi:mechanosensitive ion channel [Floridanema evergladense]|uniref:Mechanosensitive ion channel n=1 Tax=Floridaenema evergladense BLCC-F167 TaxID=3153639 RepID=A0ABV4WLS1_9CYAN
MNNIWQSTAHLVIGVPTPPQQIVAQVTRTANPVNETVDVVQRTTSNISQFIPNLLAAIVILVLGWLLAIVIAWAVKQLLNRTNIDNRITSWVTGRADAESLPVEKWISDIVFWLIFIFALVAFLQALQLTAVYEPLNNLLNQVFTFLPKLAGATILLAIAWVIATVVKLVVTRSLQVVRLDERLNQEVSETNNQFSVSETIGNTLYWFIFLLFLPSILSTLELEGTLQPVQRLLNDILSVLPNIFAAILIGAVGWVVAQVVRRIVTNLLVATGTDRFGASVGINPSTTGQSLSWIIGTIVYVLILIPVAIAALNALRINAISIPAIAMLNDILSAVPRIFAAGIILAIAYAIGRFLADVVTSILSSIGFNNVFNWIGFSTPRQTRSRIVVSPSTTPIDSPTPGVVEEKTTAARTPSEIVGIIVLVGIVLLATVAAVEVLNFAALTAIVTGIVAIAGQILIGLVIFAIGLYLANLAFNIITSSGNQQAVILGNAARIAIIILVSAMALQQMGIAADIVNLAFGLLLGAIAVATAIAFGLGSRDVAGEQVRDWLESFKRKKNEPPRL